MPYVPRLAFPEEPWEECGKNGKSHVTYRRDHTDIDHAAIKRRQALTYSIDQLGRAANALQAARAGNNGLRDAVLASVADRLRSLLAQLQSLE
jgi:hypothetical protein